MWIVTMCALAFAIYGERVRTTSRAVLSKPLTNRPDALAELDSSPGVTVATVEPRAAVLEALHQWYHGYYGLDLGEPEARREALAELERTPELTVATVEVRMAVFLALYHWYRGYYGRNLDSPAARHEALAELERTPDLTVATVEARVAVFRALILGYQTGAFSARDGLMDVSGEPVPAQIHARRLALADLDRSPGLTLEDVESVTAVFRALYQWYSGRVGHDPDYFAAKREALAELHDNPGLTVEDVEARTAERTLGEIRRSGVAEEPAPPAETAEPAADECAICFDRENDCVFLPCRHEFCATCAAQLVRPVVCPLCRGEVKSIVGKAANPTATMAQAPADLLPLAERARARALAARRDPPPTVAPPSGAAPTQAADSEALTQLTEMGFAPAQARNALDASGGNIEVAVGMSLGDTANPTATLAQAPADDSEAVAELTSNRFASVSADQARDALEATGGNVQHAAFLLGMRD